MQTAKKIHIGTSGWHYDDWKGPFYPEETPAEQMLSYYAGHFGTVEINNSFYNLPAEKTLKNWGSTVPKDFLFAVKASRYITHMKKLKDPQEPVGNFLERIGALDRHLGPILFQLPPNWKCNGARLGDFLKFLPDNRKYVFEFRDPSWFTGEIFSLLDEAGAAFCIYDLAGRFRLYPAARSRRRLYRVLRGAHPFRLGRRHFELGPPGQGGFLLFRQ